MAGTPEKGFDDMRDEDGAIVVGGDRHRKWNRKESGVRRVHSLLPEREMQKSRIHHVLLNEGMNVLLDDEAYVSHIRGEVWRAAQNQLVASQIELNKLRRRMALLESRIEILSPLAKQLELEEDRDTIPAKSGNQEVEKGTLTVEVASEYLLSCVTGKVKGNAIVCNGIHSFTLDGVERLATWYGTLRFPDMNAIDFGEEVRQAFLKGNVEAVFAGDSPVMTKGDKKNFQSNKS
ncbi:MAG: hypothetical protein R3B71_03130 [Candidatus Gracilibacteria bacterium]